MSDTNTVAGKGLPPSGHLDIAALSRLFDDRATSYKFFFFLAILDRIEKGQVDRPMQLRDLAVDMVLAAWYPRGFCRLSFGSQDRLQGIVDGIDWGAIRGSWIMAGGEDWERLRARCEAGLDSQELTRFVPYRLIRPFFDAELRGAPDQAVNDRVSELADRLFSERRPFYCFTADRDAIIIHHEWAEYFERNATIIRGWARFQLAEYLQARNPATPGLVEKLTPPLSRTSLAKQNAWWREALPFMGDTARCIYSGAELDPAGFSLDHYLPWSFVVHDRLWNLVPVERAINSAKSDRLPDRRYLERLAAIQHASLCALHKRWSGERWTCAVEPWILDLGIRKDSLLDLQKLRTAYEETIPPLELVAERQGFAKSWLYIGTENAC